MLPPERMLSMSQRELESQRELDRLADLAKIRSLASAITALSYAYNMMSDATLGIADPVEVRVAMSGVLRAMEKADRERLALEMQVCK